MHVHLLFTMSKSKQCCLDLQYAPSRRHCLKPSPCRYAHGQVQALPPYDQLCVALLLNARVVAMTNGSDLEAGSGSQCSSITLISIRPWHM